MNKAKAKAKLQPWRGISLFFFPLLKMEDVAGIGALLRPNKYSILKFVNIHPGVF
jgi:hypothetical protein